MQEPTTATAPITTATATTRDDEVNDLGRRKILILYGSETGNSEESAGDIERLARRLHFRTVLEEMNDVELVSWYRHNLVPNLGGRSSRRCCPRLT